MSKTKSLEIFLNDFNEIYNTILNLSLNDHIRDALYFDSKEKLNKVEIDIFEQLKQFSRNNSINNYLLINLVSITETYLKNVIFEELEKSPNLYHKFILEYRIDKNISPKDLIDGPEKFANEILNGIIYHNFPKVNSVFKIITKIDILNVGEIDFNLIFKIIKLRHKIVHSSSKVKSKKISIREVTLLNFMNLFSNWLITIDNKILGEKTKKVDYQMKFYRKISKLLETPLLTNGHHYSAANSTEILDNMFNDENKILI